MDQPTTIRLTPVAYVKRGQELFTQQAGLYLGFTLVAGVAMFVLFLIPLFGAVAAQVLSPPLLAGYHVVSRKVANNQPVEFGDFFKGFDRFGPLLVVGLLTALLTSLGFALLLLPGIYLVVTYVCAIPIALFVTEDGWKAMELSRKVLTQDFWNALLFWLLLLLINAAGALLCGVGLLFTIPLSYCAIYACFEHVFGDLRQEVDAHPDILDTPYSN